MGLVAFVLAVVQHVKALPWNILICFHVFHVSICREPQLMIAMFEFRAFPKRMSWNICLEDMEDQDFRWTMFKGKRTNIFGAWESQKITGYGSNRLCLVAFHLVQYSKQIAMFRNAQSWPHRPQIPLVSQTPNSFGCRQSSRWPIPEPRNVWAPVLWVLATAVFLIPTKVHMK